MAQDLVASLVLTLKDQLGGGLAKLTEQLDKMRGIADQVQLRGLQNATETLDGVARSANKANGMLARMQTLARETGEAFRAMGGMAAGGFNRAWQEAQKFPGKVKAFSEAGSNLIGAGFGAAAEGYAVVAPAEAWAKRDKGLRQQAMMEGLRGQAVEVEIARLNKMINADAYRNAVGSDSVMDARYDLLGQGIGADKVDRALAVHTMAAKAYAIPPDILGPVTAALVNNLKIDPSEEALGGGLAALAKASQSGRVKMVDFAHAMPGLTGVAQSLGMTGRGSLNELAAGLEISAKTAVDPTQAAVNFQDLLGYITSNREDNLARKKQGLDMPALLLRAEKQGTNPLDAYLAEIRKLTAGKSPVAMTEIISHLVTNQQARFALLSLMQNWEEFQKRQKDLASVGGDKLGTDWLTSMFGPDTRINRLNESLHQLTLTLGKDFMPVIGAVGWALKQVNDGLTWLDENFPETTSWVLGALGSFIALGAALTVVGAVAPLFARGLAVLVAPLRMLAAFAGISAGALSAILLLTTVVAAAAIDIYDHWGRFRAYFMGMWDGIKEMCRGVGAFFKGVFTGDMHMAVDGITHAFEGLRHFFDGLIGVIKQLFVDFGNWVDGWSGGLASRLEKTLMSNIPQFIRDGMAGPEDAVPAAGGGRGSPLAGAPGASGNVNVHVSADPGLNVRAGSSSPNINVTTTPNRGATVTRP